jgi:hypothetical protein
MPRKKTLKRKIRNKIPDLEHAQENHSGKKSIFGGLRLVLPGMTGNATTSSLSVRSKTSALHTTPWSDGESGLARPLNNVETGRTASSWAQWSSVEANTVENKRNEAPPQQSLKQSRKTKLRPHSTTVHDENTSRYIEAVNNGLRFSKKDPPAEPPNVRRPGLRHTMNNRETIKLFTTEEHHKPGNFWTAASGIHPIPNEDDSDSNVLLKNAFEPKLTEYEYYQQRSAHGGRLGIEERIDVFEPQIESQQRYVNDQESLRLRIIPDDDSTTRDSNFAASNGNSAYTPSLVTQSSINNSHLDSIQIGVDWPHESENLIRHAKVMPRGSPTTDAPPVLKHLPVNELTVNEASTIHEPDQGEVFDRIDNLAAQQMLMSAASGNSQVRIVMPNTGTKKPFVPGRNQAALDGLKKEARNDSLLPGSIDNSSAKKVPVTKEQSETEEIDRLLAILDNMTHDITNAKKVEWPGNEKNGSYNIPPQHNSPRKLFPVSHSPKRVYDIGSEPSMSFDGTFTERLKREAFAVFDDDEKFMIDNPHLSPAGMESLYSKSLSESPQHVAVRVERQYDNSVKVENTEIGVTADKILQNDSFVYLPVANIGGETAIANTEAFEATLQKPLQSSVKVEERNPDTVALSERDSDFLSGRKLHSPLYAAMRNADQFPVEPQIVRPNIDFKYNDKAIFSQLSEIPQRDTVVSANENQNTSSFLQNGGKSLVSSTLDADKFIVHNPFRSLENGHGQLLQRPERVFKDKQQPSPSFIENDRTRLPFSSKIPSFGETKSEFFSQEPSKTVMSSPKKRNCENHPSSMDQSYDASTSLYDDSGNQIVHNETRSWILDSVNKSYSKERKSSFAVYDQKTVVTSSNFRVLQKDVLPIVRATGSYINELTEQNMREKSTVLKSQKKAPSNVIEKQGYASSPIRNYWRDYSNVRVGGSFDSMSLKNDRSEESTVCGTEAKHSSFLNSISEKNCSYVQKSDNQTWKKKNQGIKVETTVPNSRSFQSSVAEHQPLDNRNAGNLETLHDGSLRNIRSLNQLLSPVKLQEYSHAEKYIISTPIEQSSVMHENINSPETEFMNFSTASERATKEYNKHVQRAISPVKRISENHYASKPFLSHAETTDASPFVTIHDGSNTDDTKITPILRYKQYANDAANRAVLNGLNVINSTKDDGIALETVNPQSKGSHDPIARTKLPPGVQPAFEPGFFRNALVPEVRQSSMLQSTCPSFDSDIAIAEDIVEVLSVASSEEIRGEGIQKVISNENLPNAENLSPLPIRTILPPWPPPIQNQFSDTVAGKESFEATSCITETNDVRDRVQRTILPKRDTRRKNSNISVYSNDLPSPLRHRLINAMSPLLSGDTMDEDSVSEWSSRYEPSRAGGSEAANVQCCSILSCFDFGTIEEKLRAICRFDDHTK